MQNLLKRGWTNFTQRDILKSIVNRCPSLETVNYDVFTLFTSLTVQCYNEQHKLGASDLGWV